MSNNILVREARRRREIFQNLQHHLQKIKEAVKQLDNEARLYLFGSAARGDHIYASDVDILIVTKLHPAHVIADLRKLGFDEPFEFHVAWGERAEMYLKSADKIVEL